MARERSFHKDLPVKIYRKRLFRKSEGYRAIMSDISRVGGRLLTRAPLLEGYQIAIEMTDPDSDRERQLPACVKSVGTIDFRGKRIFEVRVEFLKLRHQDFVMLENLFYI